MSIVVCLKWVSLRPVVDPLTAEITDDSRWFGLSSADEAALEVALGLGEQWATEVIAVSAGSVEAEGALRSALGCGADRAIRVESSSDAPSDRVAAGLAEAIRRAAGADMGDADASDASISPLVVVCGDYSLDRGTGSVPAYLAEELGAAQALGLIGLTASATKSIDALRRLDGGRRERLSVSGPAVISVEGSVARLRRAPLAKMLAAERAVIAVVDGSVDHGADGSHTKVLRPYRPRARTLPPPVGGHSLDRIRILTGAAQERTPPRRLELDPVAAADAVLDQLRSWGYLDR
ncbi:MAG: mycofactocin-associated electron transfer flavoprotein beta subunit [Acidimicrobiia bacterium]